MQRKQQRQSRMERIRNSLKNTSLVSKNSMQIEAKEEKIKSRRQSLQLAADTFQSEKLLRKFSDEDEEEERNMQSSFDEKYKLKGMIGEGANAKVCLCEYLQNGKVYAVKMVKMEEEHYLELKKTFLNIKMLRHSNIIRYRALYFDHQKRLAYLIMEYFPCKNLLQLNIKEEEQLKIIFIQVFSTLVYLHERNMCHRDLKPQNILYDPVTKKLKIIDFGISKKTFQRGQRRDMLSIIGTLFYFAPEIVMGGGYDERVDLWSIGVTIYKLITGVTPFETIYHGQTINNIIKGQVNFDPDIWKNYSFFVKDLVIRLLKPRQSRLSAKEALQHLWISQPSPGKFRRGSQSTGEKQQAKFGRHDSGRMRVFGAKVQEENLNIKHATAREEGWQHQQSEGRVFIKAKRLNLMENKQFDLSDSDSDGENTSPETAKSKNKQI